MLQFLNPIWLLAVGAIIVPVAIHLWNVKKGKTLKIGSIQLLGESSKQNSRSLRLQDLWLLLIRCLLLSILAVLLATPLIIRRAPAEKVKGWILLDKSHLQESYQAFKLTIDSLEKLGFETHYFNPGFGKFELADTAEAENDGSKDLIPQVSYWSLAKALNDHLPGGATAYLFTGNKLNRFTGSRPLLRSRVTWKTYSMRDSVYHKIAGAYMTDRDSLRIILAQSTTGSITHSSINTSMKDPDPAYELANRTGTAIRFNSDGDLKNLMDSSSVAIDTSKLRIALFTDRHPADLAYVKAALEAVKSFSERRIHIQTYRDKTKLPAGSNWLFWLSETPIDRNVRINAQNIFAYQPGKTAGINNSFIRDHDDSLFEPGNTGLYKGKSINNPDQEDNALWEDVTGNPVLTRSAKGEYLEYKFYSHFDPEWNDLVWDPRFPEALLGLIFDKEKKSLEWNNNDRRTLALAQILPAGINEAAKKSEEVQLKEIRFDKFLWILFILLLALERWVSHKKRSITANG